MPNHKNLFDDFMWALLLTAIGTGAVTFLEAVAQWENDISVTTLLVTSMVFVRMHRIEHFIASFIYWIGTIRKF